MSDFEEYFMKENDQINVDEDQKNYFEKMKEKEEFKQKVNKQEREEKAFQKKISKKKYNVFSNNIKKKVIE